jgi:transposase-like protein
MPILPPVAASGAREPERAARHIPSKVKAAVVDMVNEGIGFVEASQLHGLRPATMRTWLHRPEVVALIRAERKAYRQAILGAAEHALADVMNNAENSQARVNAAKAIVELDRDEYARPAADRASPGITLKFVTYATPMVDVKPAKAPLVDAGDRD